MTVVLHQYFSKRDRQSRVVGGKAPKLVAVERALAHVKYIQHRPGEDRGDGGREMFNDTEENLDSKAIRKAIRKQENSKVIAHKLTLAPEIDPADKKAFTREVMQKLSSDKGLDLDWIGVEHKNTNHHHIHLVVLGKDKNGTDVRIEKEDYAKLREWGDRYLERVHPLELERSRSEREKKQRERQQAKQRARETEKQERVRDGLELPWMHKKIIREQLEPYKEWKAKKEQKKGQKAKEPADKAPAVEKDKPYFQDAIQAAGKEWSKQNTLPELRELNQHLWDNYEDRIEKSEYKKLLSWIKEKERLGERKQNQSETKQKDQDLANVPNKEKDHVEYQGQKFSKDSSLEKLTGVATKLRDKESERLPIEKYQQLRGWIEDADRARWSGAFAREMVATDKKFYRSKTMTDLKAQEGGRVLNPLQDQMMGNPVVRLFMIEASIANALVRSIPLDDRLRDPVKEGRDELEEGRKGIDERERERNAIPTADLTPEHQRGLKGAEKKDRDNRERIEQDIEKNKIAKDAELKKQKRDRQDSENTPDYDVFDPWGRY